jgi:hypothetical protein
LASMAHRVVRGLVGGCAVLLGVGISGCAAPQYNYAADSSASTYFKVPEGWHEIGQSSLNKALSSDIGDSGAAWTVAYEGGSSPTANDFLSFGASHPFVWAQVGTLTSTASQGLSYDALRDFFLPVSSTARADVPSGYPLTGFSQIRDQVLTPGQGVHGVRETFSYTLSGTADTWDEVALTNADQTTMYTLVLHCTTSCYDSDQAQINQVMSSFTVRSSS